MGEIEINNCPPPLVTVGMPVYNVELYIKKSLLSILDQSYPNIEVIVVDDHSTDHSMEIVEELKSDHPKGKNIRIKASIYMSYCLHNLKKLSENTKKLLQNFTD